MPRSGKEQGQEKEKGHLSAGCSQMSCVTKRITKLSWSMEEDPNQPKEEEQIKLFKNS